MNNSSWKILASCAFVASAAACGSAASAGLACDPSIEVCDPQGDGARGCVPKEILGCADEATAIQCSADGTAKEPLACDRGCNEEVGRCNECAPDTTRCDGDTALSCGADGMMNEVEECPAGCMEGRCLEIEPANGLGAFFDEAASADDVAIPTGSRIDTDSGVIVDSNGNRVDVPSLLLGVPGSLSIRVFWADRLALEDLEADGLHPIAFVAHGDIQITGRIRVRAGEMLGEVACVGKSGQTGNDVQMRGGGGGGGFGDGGGRGGSSAVGLAGGFGGLVSGAASLEPLRGGCPGGTTPLGSQGGRGGGAIQLVSRTRIELVADADAVPAHINAGGTGGKSSKGIPGGGGGSGGAILLEAPEIAFGARTGLAANGGAGGISDASLNGRDGQFSTAPAPAHDGAGQCGALGGAATGAVSGDSDGGGGSVGRIRLRTRDGKAEAPIGTVLSPQPVIERLAVH